MANDGKADLEMEYHTPREYGPDRLTGETTKPPSVPRLREIEVPLIVNGVVKTENNKPDGRPLMLTGPQKWKEKFVLPSSVGAKGVLDKTNPMTLDFSIHMFAHGLRSFVPNRIAAVVPSDVKEFTRALVFFHPLPTPRVGYDDAQYADQTGQWRSLYRYTLFQGVQLAASGRKQVLIFPIFNLASTETCGRFPAEWKSLVEEIMAMLRKSYKPGLDKEPKPKLTDLVTASFSAGVKYMHTFLERAADLKGNLREVYDYDGRFSTYHHLSESIRSRHVGVKVLTYDQHPVKRGDAVTEAGGKVIHVPEWRWHDLSNGQSSFLGYEKDPLARPTRGSAEVHGAIPRFLMYHSLKESSVG